MEKIITIIDDKYHAIKQIKYCFPSSLVYDFQFIHFETFEKYNSELSKKKVNMIFLDFFLDKDKLTGNKVIHKLNSEYLICFSSMEEASIGMKNLAIEINQYDDDKVYSLKKIKETLENIPLRNLLKELLEK